MTPDERARAIIEAARIEDTLLSMLCADVQSVVMSDLPPDQLRQLIAAAIRDAVVAERNEIARLVYPKSRTDPQYDRLAGLAEFIRSRPRP